jgi:hypothetical protein
MFNVQRANARFSGSPKTNLDRFVRSAVARPIWARGPQKAIGLETPRTPTKMSSAMTVLISRAGKRLNERFNRLISQDLYQHQSILACKPEHEIERPIGLTWFRQAAHLESQIGIALGQLGSVLWRYCKP